ncbi:MAG: DUF3089 domain-containing protein [Chitinophagaceae bacterium]|nr:DUF3089 domain-containing protein [Chitinophagaceae bacterium]
MKSFFFLLFGIILLCSCSDKYQAFRSNYQFKSPDGKPAYSQLDYWAAHPWKKDPSDSTPQPLRSEPKDSLVDVFYIHPTTYTEKRTGLNAVIDNDYINAKTDYSSMLFQASVFNQQCRVFSPRYRQAHISTFFMKDRQTADSALAIAYEDLKAAFEYYLKTWNRGRPIIIAGHSQGALMAEKILKDYFEGKQLMNKLVVAYAVGWPIQKDLFSSDEVCKDSLQTGCICGWRTFRNGYVPSYLKNENGNSYITNPLTWITTNEPADKTLNKGSVLTKFNKLYKQTTGAKISKGLLYVSRPRFPWSFLYFTKNYHVADINLFYVNIQEDIKRRIGFFWK